MTQIKRGTIRCEACGRESGWKPEFAGLKVRCRCGHVSVAPAEPARIIADDDHYGLADDGKSRHSPIEMKAPAAAPSPAGPSAPSKVPPAPYRKASAEISEGDTRQQLLKLAIPLGAVIAILLAVVVFKMTKRSPLPTAAMLGDDGEVSQMIQTQGATEILSWLNAGVPQRMVMGMSREKAAGLSKKLYDMGAKQVLAFGAGMTGSLAIELPEDPTKRKTLFEWQKRWHEEMLVKPAEDVGQKYLLIKMRL